MKTLRSIAFTCTLVVLAAVATADPSEAKAAQAPVDLSIEAQPLESAILQFAQQSGLQVSFYRSDVMPGLISPPLVGKFQPEEALKALLRNSGLKYKFFDERTVAIRPEREDKGTPSVSGIRNIENDVRVAQAPSAAEGDASQGDGQPARKDAAQQSEGAQLEEIVVTGSHIRGASSGGSAVISIDRDQIRRTGFSGAEQLIESLPQNFGGEISSNMTETLSRINDSSGASGANLRGLGVQSTLVLVNGRRVAGSGSIGAFTDISLIPLSAIERVDVLTDGASAIYGSDAVAGVVNFVLRDDVEGAETTLRAGSVTSGDYDELRFAQMFGHKWSSGNVLVNYEYSRQSDLKSEDRDFAKSLPGMTLLPEQERHGALLAVNQRLSDRVRIFGEGVFSRRDNFQITNIPEPLATSADVENYGLSGGAAIALSSDWTLQLSGHFSQNQYLARFRSIPGLSEPFARDSEASLTTFLAQADGTLARIWSGDVKLALGAERRREALNTARLPASIPSDVQALHRDVTSGFAELLIPLVSSDSARRGLESLELTLAGRIEEYSEIGSTSNPKVGLRWAPMHGLSLRGTYGTSFRAPNLTDLTEQDTSAQLANISDLGQPEDGRLVLLMSGSNAALRPETAETWTVGVDIVPPGVPGLKLSATYFDIRYTDRIDNGQRFIFDMLQDPTLFSPFLNFDPDQEQLQRAVERGESGFGVFNFAGPGLDPDPNVSPLDADIIMELGLTNVAVANADGVDLSLQYAFETGTSAWNLSLLATRMNRLAFGFASTAPPLDTIDTVFNPVDLRMRGGLAWTRGAWSATGTANYTSGYRDSRFVPARPIDSWVTLDAQLSYTFGERETHAWLGNIRCALSVLNAFDRDPPAITDIDPDQPDTFDTFGYDGANANPLGRFVAFEITKIF